MVWARLPGTLSLVIFVAALSAFAQTPDKAAVPEIPATGKTSTEFASFDHLMSTFLTSNRDVPGGTLAMARDGHLVYARGFGYADREKMQAVEPNSLFRIASLTKPITAVAILQLVERGKLNLDEHVFKVLQLRVPDDPQVKFDERWKKITIRQLLQHTGGWDRDKKDGFDPMARSADIVAELKIAPPAGPDAIIHWMLRRPLDFDPGRRMAYSNFGYCLLGRVVEKVSGQKYEIYVRREVLAPLGITAMKLGKTLQERTKGEVKYYDSGKGPAVLGPHIGESVPNPYGTYYLEAMDAHGAWLGTAPDLVRFATAFDHPAQCKILNAKSIEEMFARPDGLAGYKRNGKPRGVYYGCGWLVRPTADGSKRNTWHDGQLAGTSTLMVRREDGLTWVALFNSCEGPQKGKKRDTPANAIDLLIHEAADA